MKPPPAPPRTREEYIIAKASNSGSLTEKVNELARDYYEAHGSMVFDNHNNMYFQPMTRRKRIE